MALPDLTGQNIENTYKRVVHTDGTNYYNGTGSLLNIGGSINTGSLLTTSSFNSYTGSSTSQFAGTSSYATQALSASWAPSVPFFPYTGSALITGSLGVTGSVGHGFEVLASGSYSHAEGAYTKALGRYSHAEGVGLTFDTNQSGSIANAQYIQFQNQYGSVNASPVNSSLTSSVFSGNFTGYLGSFPATLTSTYFNTPTYTSININFNYYKPIIIQSSSYNSGLNQTTFFYNTSSIEPFYYAVGGKANKASGVGSHTEGYSTVATGDYSHAEGYNTAANASAAHAEGSSTNAAGGYSHAEGASTTAYGYASHAEGATTTTYGYYSHTEGYGTVTNSNYSHAEGQGTVTSGEASHAEGINTSTVGTYSHAEGQNTVANGYASHAEGGSTTTNGAYSHAEGNGTYSQGEGSHAEGLGTITGTNIGFMSENISSGVIYLNSGYGDVTSIFTPGSSLLFTDYLYDGNYGQVYFTIDSVVWDGDYTIITLTDNTVTTTTAVVGVPEYFEQWTGDSQIFGTYSHTEGNSTISVADFSHAEGQETVTLGRASHAEGFQTIATANYQHVQGQRNMPSNIEGAFIHGNGTRGSRSNLIVAANNFVDISGSLHVKPNTTNTVDLLAANKAVAGGYTVTTTGIDSTWYGNYYIDSGVNSGVFAVLYQADGKLLVGGDFYDFNGNTRNRLLRLNANGTEDTTFYANLGTAANNRVLALAQSSSGDIFVGGAFSDFNGNGVAGLVKLDSNGNEDTAFSTNLGSGFSSTIYALAVQSDGKILVGGAFVELDGYVRNLFVRLNTDGTVDSSFETNYNTSGGITDGKVVRTIEVQSDGKILVGGAFAALNGDARRSIFRLNADGTEDTTFYSNLTSTGDNSGFFKTNLSSIKQQSSGKIVVGFEDGSNFNGETRNRLVRLNADGTEDTAFYNNFDPTGTGGINNSIFNLALQLDNKILIGGNFTELNANPRHRLVRLNEDGSEDDTFYPLLGSGFDESVRSITTNTSGDIVVGGDFHYLNESSQVRLSKLNSITTYTEGLNENVSINRAPDNNLINIKGRDDAHNIVDIEDVNGIKRLTFDNTGSLSISGSIYLNDILVLNPRTTTPDTPTNGMIIVSGSGVDQHMYCYLNDTWKQLDN